MVTRDDLQPGQRYAFLWCPACDSRYSADSGDYFWMQPDDHFVCECGEPMELASESKTIHVLSA